MQMKIYFKEENNVVTIESNENSSKDGIAGEQDAEKGSDGNQPGRKLGDLVTYTMNPNRQALNLPGGGFYWACF